MQAYNAQSKLQREPVEYVLRWIRQGGVCDGHVHFILFVSCSLVLGSQRECNFWWNMGVSVL